MKIKAKFVRTIAITDHSTVYIYYIYSCGSKNLLTRLYLYNFNIIYITLSNERLYNNHNVHYNSREQYSTIMM